MTKCVPCWVLSRWRQRRTNLDMIGWLIDLDAQLVTISEKNFNKTLHAFFSFNIVEPVTLHQVQVMASLASRYTQISVVMKVHVGALY
jgi:hypothetical protein